MVFLGYRNVAGSTGELERKLRIPEKSALEASTNSFKQRHKAHWRSKKRIKKTQDKSQGKKAGKSLVDMEQSGTIVKWRQSYVVAVDEFDETQVRLSATAANHTHKHTRREGAGEGKGGEKQVG